MKLVSLLSTFDNLNRVPAQWIITSELISSVFYKMQICSNQNRKVNDPVNPVN